MAEMLRKRLTPLLICLLAATAAYAQPGGGRGGGRPPGGAPGPSRKAPKPLNQLEIIGVIKAIDSTAGRVTIAYEPVEPLNWPAGAQPFPVGKSALLNGVSVGEKVRFTLDSGEITTLAPF
jgi:Cu/Ag efflux protein CusF